MYFWMNLKENSSAILAANIYDIRKKVLYSFLLRSFSEALNQLFSIIF